MTTHADQIRELLGTYERSLKTGDARLAASCYTPDGVFMPTNLPTSEGAEMEGAYRNIFNVISLDVSFRIDELETTSDRDAYALTQSSGTQTVLQTGEQTAESNRELFLFRRLDSGWKIARYMFNKSA